MQHSSFVHHVVGMSWLSVLSNKWQRCEWESSQYSDSSIALWCWAPFTPNVSVKQCRKKFNTEFIILYIQSNIQGHDKIRIILGMNSLLSTQRESYSEIIHQIKYLTDSSCKSQVSVAVHSFTQQHPSLHCPM